MKSIAHPILQKASAWLILSFVFLTLLYPLFHNSIIYILNFLFDAVGVKIGKWNYFLLGWKDAFLIFILPLLILRRNIFIGGIVSLGIVLGVLLKKILIIKELLFPAAVILVYFLYQDECVKTVLQHRKFFLRALIGLILTILLIGYGDYFYRTYHDINMENLSGHNYMMLNNEIRCSKILASGGDDAVYKDCVLNNSLNFYKLKHVSGDYERLQALFLPVGDSVVFSFILTYAFIFLFCFNQSHRPLSWGNFFLYTFTLSSIFMTLNRVNSILAIISVFLIFIFQGKKFLVWRMRILFLLIPLIIFLFKSDYLLFSIFDKNTPSNLGHIETVKEVVRSATILVEEDRKKKPVLDHVERIEKPKSSPHLEKSKVETVQKAVGSSTSLLDEDGKEKAILNNDKPIENITPQLNLEKPGNHEIIKEKIKNKIGIIKMFFLKIQKISQGGPISKLPVESNAVKILGSYGTFGITVYIGILIYIAVKIFQLIRLLFKSGFCIENSLVILLGGTILAYQFISPYIISGYVVFFPFISLFSMLPHLVSRGNQL